MKYLAAELRASLIATALIAVILCGAYPLIVFGLAQGIFPGRANGSLILRDSEIAGSRLIGQQFTDPRYFHPRPSAAGAGYDATRSGGSNLGPTSRRLIEEVGRRVAAYRTENGLAPGALVPADAVTASASGLDPHISVRNAVLQARRVARARGLGEEAVLDQIKRHTESRTLGLLGEPRVNVLLLNGALDGMPRPSGAAAALGRTE
jgi:K+-transporting ATPase ATPase C chain